jgi:hypothetical protein
MVIHFWDTRVSNVQQLQEPAAQEQELPQEQEEFPQPDILRI